MLAGAPRPAEADIEPDEGLQLEGHVFDDMPQVGAVPQAAEESAFRSPAALMEADPGEERTQAVGEAGEVVAGAVLVWPDVDDGVDDGSAGVHVGPFEHSHRAKNNAGGV